MPKFWSSNKNPQEIIKCLKDSLSALAKTRDNPLARKKPAEEVTKFLYQIKLTLLGTPEAEASPEAIALLTQEIYNTNILMALIEFMSLFEFECRKDLAGIFNNVLKRQLGTRYPTVEYLAQNLELLFMLIRGYEQHEIALNCGLMLRECTKHEVLTKIILYSPDFYRFFSYIRLPVFDIASDAFSSFREILTRHKLMASEFLEQSYDELFSHYSELIDCDNYVTRRQSLKLLGELLLDRHNFTVMSRYISSPENLRSMMNLLCNQSRNIQFEAFHVFKVFVANPNKSQPVSDILLKNKDKLVEFLSRFQTDRTEDEQFNDEKAYLIKQIRTLKPASITTTVTTTTTK